MNNWNICLRILNLEQRHGRHCKRENDISEGINNLQTFGLVGKLNPKYEKLVIYLSTEEANEILKECTQEVEEAMMQLALCF